MAGSFKRFLECLFVWGAPQAKGDPAKACLIVTQANANLTSGATSDINKMIARVAAVYARRYGAPIFPQAEVGEYLEGQGIQTVGGRTPFQADRPQGSESYEVARWQKSYYDKNRLEGPILLATTRPHCFRAVRIYEKMGFKVVVMPDAFPPMIFQKGLRQWFWRTPWIGYPYELLARLYYLYMGYL